MFEANSSQAGSGPSAGNSAYIQPTLNHGLRLWWAYFWPTTLLAGILDVTLVFWMRLLYENTDLPGWLVIYPMRYAPLAMDYIVGILTMYYLLHRRFRRFRIALFPVGVLPESAKDATPLPATFLRSLRVWWTFTWRKVVYSVIAYVVVLLPLSWFAGVFNPRAAQAAIFFYLAGLVVNGAVSLFVIYSNILDEDFGEFTVRLVARTIATDAPAISAPSFAVNQP
jgi:hypothetical protein